MAVQIICDLFRLICLVDRLVEIGELSNTAGCADDQVTRLKTFLCLACKSGCISRAGSDEENLANFFVFYVFSDR